ncbi:cation-translocating P-type ATPase [Xaviernesmea oryzae]|uniref:Cu2+-exporting ATPase n=1 Tax=Xaviernesmea oryzae TaxID=464029 RepID=A0A1X7DU20_9HYPH|nr:cation-translocating P-type ATPase [Xaviernesmea oryzae]SMF21599.1 Cu2+-exporting ATPase [Xaviernesmea oryzae]
MSCCAPGAEGSFDRPLPSSAELKLASRIVGPGLRQTDLSVPQVHCGTCITAIEKALNGLPLVERARVNLSMKRVTIIWKEKVGNEPADPAILITAIVGATGYDAHLFANMEDAGDMLQRDLIRAVAVSGFAAANIMLLSVSVWSGAEASTRDLFHWISAMIAAPALIYGGRFFYQSAWKALRGGRTNMDVPIALAITLSYAASLWETMHHGEHAWFDATVSLLFFLLIGRTLDHVMRDRARAAITGLARLSPRGATLIGADGSREYRAIEDITPGDRIAIAAGERVPVDGVVETGASDMDVSIVNGESAPKPVKPGDQLQAGTLSLTGSLVLRATTAAKDSFLSEVISLMEAAEGGRARYRRLADRAAQYYSPAVHLLALAAFLCWGFIGGDWKQAMLVSIAVLIITCPCALGLSVPVVQVVAAGRLFKNGIMVKDGSAMERLEEVDAVLFDKTGTLTLGRPRLLNIDRIDEKHLALAAGLAVHSRHPLSQALAHAVSGPVVIFETVKEIPGQGLESTTPTGIYRLGNRYFALSGPDEASPGNGLSETVLSLDGREIATFRFDDMPRPGAQSVVASLSAKGFETGMLSGDRREVVANLAIRLGLHHWQAELSPKQKAQFCTSLAEKDRKVLMVGDGINDAPALAAAHVSIAPATATDIGRQAADFVFMHDSLEAVPLAIDLSRRAGRLIRENFALAIGYNIVAVPIALAGYATPLIAAIAMSTSSIIVVANAMRLNGALTKSVPSNAAQSLGEGARLA